MLFRLPDSNHYSNIYIVIQKKSNYQDLWHFYNRIASISTNIFTKYFREWVRLVDDILMTLSYLLVWWASWHCRICFCSFISKLYNVISTTVVWAEALCVISLTVNRWANWLIHIHYYSLITTQGYFKQDGCVLFLTGFHY